MAKRSGKLPLKKAPCTFDQETLAKIDAILKGNRGRPPQAYRAILEAFPGREPLYEKFSKAYRDGITPQNLLEALFSPVAIKKHRPHKVEKRHRAGQEVAPGNESSPTKKDPPLQGTCERCHRAWKDILAKGGEHGVFEEEGTAYTFHTVGRGVTQQRCIGLKNSKDITFAHIGFEATKHHVYGLQNEASILNRGRHSRTLFMPVVSDFRSYLAAEEFKAKKILQDSGYQIEPGENSPPLSKQEILRRILNSLEQDGLCEHITKEWFAAKILTVIYKLLDAIDFSSNLENMLVLTAELGGFIRQVEIRFGPVASQARGAGKSKKKISAAAQEFVSSLFKKNRKATCADLWKKMIPGEDGALKIDDDIKVYIELDREGREGGEWFMRYLVKDASDNWGYHKHRTPFNSFRRYFTVARKSFAR